VAVVTAAPPGPYGSAVAAVHNHADDLSAWLAVWSARDDSRPDARARRCAADAVNAIDAALAELHGIRARLVSEIRASDDAAAARADALLAEHRGGEAEDAGGR
jgi:hypothetical protein